MMLNRNFELSATFINKFLDRLCGKYSHERKICVLNYHRILEFSDPLLPSEPDAIKFRSQMELLANHFNVLPLCKAMNCLQTGKVPTRAVCITFDDGYKSVHDCALPVLRHFGLPATVFVTSGSLIQGNMWNDQILAAIRACPDGQLDLSKIGLSVYEVRGSRSREEIFNTITAVVKYQAPEVRAQQVSYITQLLQANTSSSQMLTENMLVNLANNGIEIGGHTVSHPILTSLDEGTALHEINHCKIALEKIVQKPINFFAYPNGKYGQDYDDRHIQMVKEAGYIGAFSTALGAASRKHDRYQIPRSRPWDSNTTFFGLRIISWLL